MGLFTINDAQDVLASAAGLGLGRYVNLAAIAPSDMFAKLQAAERDVSRRLRVFFEPMRLIPDDAPQSELDALDAANVRYQQEPAYDYDPDFFRGERWGFVVTQSSPIISVESVKFAYPTPGQGVWTVPNDWLRFDRQHGHIRFVPAASAISAPLSAFVMQALGGGRTIPFMIQLRYTAGLKNAAEDYPDLLDVVKKMAYLKLLQGAFLPSSGSISADGLSQSSSVDMQKWHDGIDDQIEVLREAIHGIQVVAL